MPIETLNLEGMDIDQGSWSGESLRADFGSGYGAKAVVGVTSGLHRWTISSGCLPDDASHGSLIDGLPRFEYYWEFFKRHTTGTNDVFIFPFRGKLFHTSFAEPQMSYEMFTIDLFGGSGVEIEQRRLDGYNYNDDGSISPYQVPTNWALNSEVTANQTYANSRPEQAVNGTRHTDNEWAPYALDGGSGGWDSGSATADVVLEVNFGTQRTFRHVRMYTLRDSINYNIEPTVDETFTAYGNTEYEIDYWNGVAWVNIVSVTGNTKVVREHTFPAITASKVRFVGLATADSSSTPHARLVELEVWTDDPRYAPMGSLEIIQKLIIENQWPNGLPTIGATSFTSDGGPAAAFDLNGDSDLLTFNIISGLTLKGYVYRPVATPPVGGIVRNAWIINILGHETVADGIDRVQYFVDRGFSTILLGMPNFEPNDAAWTYTRNVGGTVSISGADHAQYASVIEPDGTPILPLFLDQIFRAAHWIREQYPGVKIHLTGHSGGGFMTSMAAILDNGQYFNIKNSNAGEMPFAVDSTPLHVEQSASRPWWDGNDWDDLYPIAARFGKFTKSHNEQDPAFQAFQRYHIFREIAEDVNATVTTSGYAGKFEVYIDPAQMTHDYSPTNLQKFVDDCIVVEPTFTTLDPTTIAWAAYLAAAYTGLNDGDNVGNWNDSTANDRDATVIGTPQWRVNQIKGKPALEMSTDSSDGFTLPSMAALTEVSSIEVSKTNFPAGNGGSNFGTDAVNASHWPYNANPGFFIYDAFGSTARKGPIIPASDLAQWGVHYCWSKANDWGVLNDWQVAYTTVTNTVGCPASPKLWQNLASLPQVGLLAARWIFSAKLTDDQRLRIKAWIQQEFF